ARHSGGSRAHRHGHERSRPGFRRPRALDGLVRRGTDRRSEEGRGRVEARDREGEGRTAGAPRHDHAKTMTHGPIRKVGFIGAGRMGMPMVGHVVKRGFEVAVYDVDPAKRAGVESRKARWETDCRALARSSEAILVCVGYDRELRELLAAEGALAEAPAGTIVAILST